MVEKLTPPCSPNFFLYLASISSAAFLEKVTIKTFPGSTPFEMILPILLINVVVFPEPGQEIKMTGPSVVLIAFSCDGFLFNFSTVSSPFFVF